jgi:cell division protein FtsB
MAQYQIKHLNPAQQRNRLIAVAVLVCVLAIVMYVFGREKSGLDFSSMNDEVSHLREQLDTYKTRESALMEENALLRQTASIEKAAAGVARQELSDIQADLVELKKELVFYESLLTPAEREPGIHIKQIKLAKTQGEEYNYELLLTQVRENDKFARGNVTVSLFASADKIEGEEAEGEVLAHFELDFKFKFFQKIEGVVNVPGGVEPDQIQVIVSPNGRRLKRVEKLYQWNELVGG